MNIQQFHYLLAVAEFRHFELAANKCFVTQSTLSTMISKFEEEIGIRVFDRRKKPVEITVEGKQIIDQLKQVVNAIEHLNELSREIKGEVRGSISISVIPTIAPFLLPLFLQDFAGKFPDLQIKVNEQTTEEIMRQLKSRELDIGIVSLPLHDKDLLELKLYDEPFVYFDAGETNKGPVSIQHLPTRNLVLMEEGHCMRTQIIKLCDLKRKTARPQLNFEFKAGSIDSLLRFVKANKSATLLPYLSTIQFSEQEKKPVCSFSSPVPYRSIGIVVHRHFAKKKILSILQKDIKEKVARVLPQKRYSGEKLSPF